jgi:hypothetical protein
MVMLTYSEWESQGKPTGVGYAEWDAMGRPQDIYPVVVSVQDNAVWQADCLAGIADPKRVANHPVNDPETYAFSPSNEGEKQEVKPEKPTLAEVMAEKPAQLSLFT